MNLTINGWIAYIVVAVIAVLLAVVIGHVLDTTKGFIISITIAVVTDILVLFAFNWYYTNTATGARAIKTQQSELSNGINREITVYDMEGDIIKTYKGKFDVTYDNDRILFDDENGKRHIIYYPTGTVIIDEIEE